MFERGTLFGRKPKQVKITLFYKSGHKMWVEVDEMSFSRKVSGDTELTWKGQMKPKALNLNLDEVESIWMGWHR